MKSRNVEGGFLFCAGWNFLKSVSVTSRLLERCEYTKSATAADFVYTSESNESYEKHSTQK